VTEIPLRFCSFHLPTHVNDSKIKGKVAGSQAVLGLDRMTAPVALGGNSVAHPLRQPTPLRVQDAGCSWLTITCSYVSKPLRTPAAP
jgi:hypothetical protein